MFNLGDNVAVAAGVGDCSRDLPPCLRPCSGHQLGQLPGDTRST